MGTFGVDGTCLQKCNSKFQMELQESMSPCVYKCYNSCNPATDWQVRRRFECDFLDCCSPYSLVVLIFWQLLYKNYCPEELQNYAMCPSSWDTEECLPQCSETCRVCVTACGDDSEASGTSDGTSTDSTSSAAPSSSSCVDDPTGEMRDM